LVVQISEKSHPAGKTGRSNFLSRLT
jgi:hypothetical protein